MLKPNRCGQIILPIGMLWPGSVLPPLRHACRLCYMSADSVAAVRRAA